MQKTLERKVSPMSEPEKKHVRRTPKERAAEIDAKIEKVNETLRALENKKQSVIATYDEKIKTASEQIKTLEEKKAAILAPKPPRKPRKTKKQKIQEIVNLAMKSGMKPEDVAAQLGIKLED